MTPIPLLPEKGGVRATCYRSALTLKGEVLAWLLEWTVRCGKVWGQEEVGRALPAEGRIRSLAQ